ncbi:MAG: hypothetical protein EA427_11775 [Spirochaetaceae bacterium]|nr:MAG: hypothetical protein EA427_11775 [Spirochaetaceae bacterium]
MLRELLAISKKVVLIIIIVSLVGCTTITYDQPIPTVQQKFWISIQSSNGGTTDPDGRFQITEGNTQRIIITPDDGYLVDSVTIDGVQVASSNIITLEVINSDRNVDVSFRRERVCLVLSVGGVNGLSHMGALDALIGHRRRQPDYVYGNSMGALVGSLYVTAPDESLSGRYRTLLSDYEETTRRDRTRSISTGVILGSVAAAIATGGIGLVAVAAAAAGWIVGNRAEPLISHERFSRTLDVYLDHTMMEDTEIEFGTSYMRKEGEGIELVVSTRGNLAEAVSRSINNPYIFKGTDLSYVDPGSDRMSAVPIEEAFSAFRPDRIIAINATGSPAIYSDRVTCEVEEIRIPVLEAIDLQNALRGADPDFTRLYRAGWDAVVEHYSVM